MHDPAKAFTQRVEETHQREVGPRSLVTACSVAAYLGVSTVRVYELCRQGLLPHVRLGRHLRFSPDAVIAWAESGGSTYRGGWRREPVR